VAGIPPFWSSIDTLVIVTSYLHDYFLKLVDWFIELD
jgi:hypothetical protein